MPQDKKPQYLQAPKVQEEQKEEESEAKVASDSEIRREIMKTPVVAKRTVSLPGIENRLKKSEGGTPMDTSSQGSFKPTKGAAGSCSSEQISEEEKVSGSNLSPNSNLPVIREKTLRRKSRKPRRKRDKTTPAYLRHRLKKYLKQQRRKGKPRTDEELSVMALLHLEKAMIRALP